MVTSIRNRSEDAQINNAGKLNLIDFCKQIDVTNCAYAHSSEAIYLSSTSQSSCETSSTKPVSPHGMSKLTAEWQLEHIPPDLSIDFTSCALANVY